MTQSVPTHSNGRTLPGDPPRSTSLICVCGLFLKISHNDCRSKGAIPCAFKQRPRFRNDPLIAGRVLILSDQTRIHSPRKPEVILMVCLESEPMNGCFSCEERPRIPMKQGLSVLEFGYNFGAEVWLGEIDKRLPANIHSIWKLYTARWNSPRETYRTYPDKQKRIVSIHTDIPQVVCLQT